MIHRTTTALAALLFAVTAFAASAGAATPPDVTIAAGAKLYVASTPAGADTPAAWVVFQTTPKVNPRLLVASVDGRSGRSYRIAGHNCVRSTVVTHSGDSALRARHRYTVKFYSRAGIGSTSPRKLVATRTIVAQSFDRGDSRRAPGCSTS